MNDIPLYFLVLVPLIGLVGMTAGGFWGVGCGWLIVPAMLIFGLSPMEAVGISLLQMIPSTMPTVVKTVNQISWGRRSLGRCVVVPMAVGAALTCFTGEPINVWMNHHFGSSALLVLFSVVMAIVGLQILFSRTVEHEDVSREFGAGAAFWSFLAGLGTGVFSSVLGIGGAIFMRPVLASGFKTSLNETAVSIRVLLLVTTLMGGLTYLFDGGGLHQRVFWFTLLISLGGIVGFPIGTWMHDIVARNGYTQHIHKSFAFIPLIVIISSVLKIMQYQILCRYVILAFACLLLTYLALFTRYTCRHPKDSTENH